MKDKTEGQPKQTRTKDGSPKSKPSSPDAVIRKTKGVELTEDELKTVAAGQDMHFRWK